MQKNTKQAQKPTIEDVMRYDPEKVVYTESSMKADSIRNCIMNVEEIYIKSRTFDLYHPETCCGSYQVPLHCSKLILRPLSQLIETITHEGKEFVPLVELFKVAYPGGFDKIEISMLEKKYGIVYNAINENGIELYFHPTSIGFTTFFSNRKIPQSKLLNLLHKWQFDLYGFIEAGYAVEMKD